MKAYIVVPILVGAGTFGILGAVIARQATRLEEAETRLMQLEKRRAEAPAATENGKATVNSRPAELAVGAGGSGGPSVDDLAKQIQSLRASLEAVKTASEGAALLGGVANSDAPGGGRLAALSEEQRKALEEAVGEVLQKREEEREKERAARMKEMANEQLARIMDDLTEKVGLTPEQRDAITPIVSATQQQVMELMQGRRDTGQRDAMGNAIVEDASRVDRRSEMQKLVADADTKVKAQLTVEQSTQYEDWRKNNPMGGRGMLFIGGGPGGAGGAGRGGRQGGGQPGGAGS